MLAGVCTGCGLLAILSLPPPDPPAELDAVIANRAQLYVAEDDPLFQTEPGAVVDDLAGLSGCWAFYMDAFPHPWPMPNAAWYQFLAFDPDGGRVKWFDFTTSDWPATGMFNLLEGTYRVVSDSRVEIVPLSVTWNFPETGAVITSTPEDGGYEEEWAPRRLLVTLDGDRLVLFEVLVEDGQETIYPEPYVFRHFSCPE
jgi:hypothetical protein